MTTSVALLEVNAANVQKAYIAYYGRPADPAGLNFWTTAGTSSTTMLTIMRDFGASAEFAALYGSGTNAAFVNAIYRNVFGRDADAGGLNFYVNALTNGSITRADVVFNVLNGATGADATIVANKVDFATQYTTALADNVSAYVNYDATFGIPQARTALSGVTATSTAAQITASVNTSVTTVAAGATPPVTTGNAYSLTTNVETISGTAYADTFDARVASTNATFNTGDVVNGGGGNDTLTLSAQGASAAVALNSVEAVNIRMVASTDLDVLNWSGTNTVTITDDSVDGTTLTLTNASLSTRYVLDDKVTLSVDVLDDSGTTDTLNVGIDGVSGAVVNATAAAIETIALGVSGTNVVELKGSANTAVSVSGQGTLTLSMGDNNATVSGISLQNFSGTSTVTVSSNTTLTFSGGAGNDTLVLANLTSGDKLHGGQGNDTLDVAYDSAVGGILDGVSGFESLLLDVPSARTTVSLTLDGFTTVTVSGEIQNADAKFSGIDGGTELNLALVSADDITLGYSGAGVANIDINSKHVTSYDQFLVTGAQSVDFSAEGATAGLDLDVTQLRIEGATTVAIRAGNTGDVDIARLNAEDTTSLSFYASGGSTNLNVALVTGKGLTSVLFETSGSAATIVTGPISVSGVTTTMTVNAGASGVVQVGGFSATNGGNLTLDLNLGNAVTFGNSTDFDVEMVSGNLALDVSAGSSGVASFGSIDVGGGSITQFNVEGGTSARVVGTTVSAGSITSIGINMAREGSASFTTVDANNGSIGDITLTAGASGLVALDAVTASRSVGNIALRGSGFSDIDVGAISAKSGVGSVTIAGDASANFTLSSIDAASATVGAISVTLAAGGSANIGTIAASGTIGLVTVNVANSGVVTIGDINSDGRVAVGTNAIAGFDIDLAGSSDVTILNVSAVGAIGNTDIYVGASGDLSIGTIGNAAETSARPVGSIVATIEDSGSAGIGAVRASGSFGGLTVTLGASAAFSIGDIDLIGTAVADSNVGGISITGTSGASVIVGAISARDDVGTISISVGGSSTFQLGAVEAQSAGTIGNITFAVGLAGVGSAESFSATVSIGSITVNAGSGTVDINSIEAPEVGNLTFNDGIVNIAEVSATTLGSITSNGDGVTISDIDAGTVGRVTVTGSAATIVFDNVGTIDNVTIQGQGLVTIDLGDADSVGRISTVGHSGSTNINLSRVDTSVDVTVGTGTNTITLSDDAGGTIVLTSNSGSDTIRFGTAADGHVIRNFEFGSGTSLPDVLSFASSQFHLGLVSATFMNSAAGNLDVVAVGASAAVITVGSAATQSATDVIVVTTGTFNTIDDVLDALGSAGSLNVSWAGGSSISVSSDLLIVWYDNDDRVTRLTLVNASATTSATNFFSSIEADDTLNLAEFNLDIRTYSSSNWNPDFQMH